MVAEIVGAGNIRSFQNRTSKPIIKRVDIKKENMKCGFDCKDKGG